MIALLIQKATAQGVAPRQIGYFYPDILVEENIKYSNDITDEPVETGEFISDHVFTKPVEIDIKGANSEARPAELSPTGAVTLGGAQLAFDTLTKLAKEKTPFTILIGFGSFPNMLINSLSITKTNETGDAIEFQASLKQVLTVTSKVVNRGNVVTTNVSGAVLAKVPAKQTVGRKQMKEIRL